MASNDDIIKVVNELFKLHEKEITHHMLKDKEELKVMIAEMTIRLAQIESAVSDKKKPVSKKSTAAAANAADDAADTASSSAADVSPVAAKKPYNCGIYFNEMYKNNEAFRNKYFTAEMIAGFASDESVLAKKEGPMRKKAEASLAWKALKENKANHKLVDAEFKAMRSAPAAEMLEAEDVTPLKPLA